MTDLTPNLKKLLSSKNAPTSKNPPAPTDEFLKEAYRINSHIVSLKKYLSTIRPAYLTTNNRHTQPSQAQNLTDLERDSIDSSTALLLRDLASSITNLSSAETLRQETEASILRKKYGHSAAGALLFRWAGGADTQNDNAGKPIEQVKAEESASGIRSVRESVLWFLRRGLEGAASLQRSMVEKRIERIREKEKSVLYKSSNANANKGRGATTTTNTTGGGGNANTNANMNMNAGDSEKWAGSSMSAPDAVHLSEADTARIEAELSPEQLQLFAEENDTMLRHYEDTLGKVQNAEKSLVEISSLQNTLVSHLATQEEYVSQLVSDADATTSNVGRGNKELKRATERKSTAQAVFWGTVGLCTWLVVWDLVF
ncbi:hypothetical protein N7478_007035 [Penicillium angulare]|uniref:uncharacterized protein n=1 Tax=Penicillium angulare TaxID=116970 RepID=UPI0025422A15|nr:uncharacterized protein N7478_007035 [Penicillium angulare]KAJ5281663.1 hypothetical protein N7478_007035 [Penicillium angulare]